MTSRDSSDEHFLAGEEEVENQLEVIKVRKSQRGVEDFEHAKLHNQMIVYYLKLLIFSS